MRAAAARVSIAWLVLVSATTLQAQQTASAPATDVPRVVRVNSVFVPANGQSAAPVEAVTLAIYAEETGGAPLWQETQYVAVGADGQYTLLLGATRTDGLPLDLFASGEARWLGRRFERPGEVEQARVLLASVPYALKAIDADSLGGRPASAYALANTWFKPGLPLGVGRIGGGTNPPFTTSTSGTTNFIGKFVGPVDLGNSAMWESGGKVGINTAGPLDVLHAAFTDTTGSITGLAVQNFASTGNASSGMLFYDQTGALAQFQGFSNLTHEYRINNIASGASINFLLGGSSKFRVAPTGFIEVSPGSTTNHLMMGPIPGGSTFSGNLGIAGDGANGQGIASFDLFGTDGILVRFRRDGSTQGSIDVNAGVVSYNAFTGTHYALTEETIERGMLVSLTGKNGRLEDNPGSEILYGVTKSRRANDPAILGAYLARQNRTATDLADSANPHLVEAVGNGEMWVIDTGRDLVVGEYLVSSAVAGHAMTDPGTFDVSYIVARAAEPIDWKDVTATVPGPDGREHKRALVSVFFENFVIDRTRSSATDAELVRMRQTIASLTAQLVALEARDQAREARLTQLENGRDNRPARTVNGVSDRK